MLAPAPEREWAALTAQHPMAGTIASIERLKQIQQNLHATVIIQHDPRDVAKLPAFPAAAH